MPSNVISKITKFIRNPSESTPLRSGVLSTFAINILGTAIAFGLQVLLARIMGVAQYGAYNYILSWLLVLVLLATAGFDSSLLRFVAAYRAKNERGVLKGLLISSFKFVAVSGLIVAALLALVLMLFSSYLDPILPAPFYIAAALIPIWALFSLTLALHQSLKQYLWARVPQFIIRPLLIALLSAVLFYFSGELSATTGLMIQFVAVAIVLFLSASALRKTLSVELTEVSAVSEMPLWIKASIALMFVAALQMLVNQIDIILLGGILPLSDVAVYSVASRIATLVLFGMQAINTVAAPMISEAYVAQNKAALQKLVSRIALWIAAFSLPLILAVIILGNWVLQVFGQEYQVGYTALILLALGQLINVCSGPVGFLLTMTGNEKASIRILLISLATNVALLIPAATLWGINGAALATAFSIVLRNLLALRAVKTTLGIDSSVIELIRRVKTRSGVSQPSTPDKPRANDF